MTLMTMNCEIHCLYLSNSHCPNLLPFSTTNNQKSEERHQTALNDNSEMLHCNNAQLMMNTYQTLAMVNKCLKHSYINVVYTDSHSWPSYMMYIFIHTSFSYSSHICNMQTQKWRGVTYFSDLSTGTHIVNANIM